MIDVVFADHQEVFHVGMAEILGGADDLSLIAHAHSAEQLLSILGTFIPHVLVLSTKFLPVFSQIESALQRRRTALLLLADADDHVAYVRWLRAQGIVYRSMDGPTLLDAVRRVARGDHSLKVSNEPSEEDAERPSRLEARG